MSAAHDVVVAAPAATEGHGESVKRGMDTALLGMMLFIASEVMFFASLFGAYFNVRATAKVWPPSPTAPIADELTAMILLKNPPVLAERSDGFKVSKILTR